MTDSENFDPLSPQSAKPAPTGKRKVSAVISTPEQKARIAAARNVADWPLPGQPYRGVGPGEWRDSEDMDDTGYLPENCPVRPLGYDGEAFYFVDTSGQIFNTGSASMGVERMQKLFAGCEDFLCWAWPSFSKDRSVTGFKAEEARRDLYAACRVRGPFSMTDMVRGRGAWRDDDGRMILHCGEYLWYDGQLHDTGEVGSHFYVRRPVGVVPYADVVDPADNPAIEIFNLLRTWNMERGDTDVMMVMGWIYTAMKGAALDWRPSIFIVGDAGTGKSALVGRNGLLRTIFGKSMIATTNASEAGLYQIVGHDSLPIAIDELEGDDGVEQSQKIIKMARDAASGSVRIRGGADHKGVEFQAQSSFLFSAINPPGIPPASLTRLAIIQLKALGNTGKEPKLKNPEQAGPRLLRLIADREDEFEAIYERYRAVLREAGHDSRGQNTFGTFLAGAHMLLGDEGLQYFGMEDMDQWAMKLAADTMPELADVQAPWLDFINKMMATQIDGMVDHGERYTVGQVLQNADQNTEYAWGVSKCARWLAAADIGLIDRKADDMGFWLAIPNSSKTIGRMMADTPFASRDGNGTWHWALRRAPESIIHRELPQGVEGRKKAGNRYSVAGSQRRCLFVAMDDFKSWQDKQ